jgi:hypothetical protein
VASATGVDALNPVSDGELGRPWVVYDGSDQHTFDQLIVRPTIIRKSSPSPLNMPRDSRRQGFLPQHQCALG